MMEYKEKGNLNTLRPFTTVQDVPDEDTTIRVVRKHWFILFRMTAGASFLMLLPIVLLLFFGGSQIMLGPTASFEFNPDTAVLIFIIALWVLIFWMKLFGIWTDYYLDEWRITDNHIIDIDQVGFFNRTVVMFSYNHIQDLTVHYPGPIANLIGYGNLKVQTAGASDPEQFQIRGIGNPEGMRQLILDCYHDYMRRQHPTGNHSMSGL